MKQFDIKVLNSKLMKLIGVPIYIVYLIAVIIFLINNVEGQSKTFLTFLIALIPAVIFSMILSKLCRKKYVVELTESEIILRRNGLVEKSIFYKNILLIRQSALNQVRNIIVFTEGSTKPQIELLQVSKSNDKMDEILHILLETSSYIETQRNLNNQLWKEYINKELIDSQASVISAIKSNKVKSKKIITIVFVVVALFTIVPSAFIIYKKSTNKSYVFARDAVYYGDRKLDINVNELEHLSNSVIKDSSHVYYNGEILQWADQPTFRCLDAPFYYDKNGVYYEKINMFSNNEIKPLEGDYDKTTFKSVGRFYYKDKDKLYKLKINVLNINSNPLEEVFVDGLDLASFELVDEASVYWFKDRNKIYFASDKKIKPAEGIDPATFEVLTFQVAKDKNHVYYITNNLESEGKSATDYSDYAILKGADAPTFEVTGYNTFEDKNKDWSIER